MSFLESLKAIGTSGIGIAALFSIIGSIIWLLFWLQEDYKRPEPKRLIALTFLYGGISTALVLPLQLFLSPLLGSGIVFLVAISLTEEVFKYFAAYFAALRRPEYDEPIDALIYLITAAVGFAAIENALYLVASLASGDSTEFIIFGIQRLITPTVLHIVVSGTVGLALASGFYASKTAKRIYLFLGIVVAMILHTTFNYLILNTSNTNVLAIGVWVAALIIIFLFEVVKRIKPHKN
ncbi:MAG: PrsW family glutamic-type intramembrane protease [bacterium]|nr:PrsW family glutamic-type intramembrane protease [bacterium]